MKPLFWWGNLVVLLFTAFLEERGSIVILEGWLLDLSSFFFSIVEAKNRKSTLVLPSNKGFINYVFWRNWAVRNPAGTRLDSSLVNKQLVYPASSPGASRAPHKEEESCQDDPNPCHSEGGKVNTFVMLHLNMIPFFSCCPKGRYLFRGGKYFLSDIAQKGRRVQPHSKSFEFVLF